MKFENIEWLFFDVGSTLVDESEVYVDRINKIAKAAGKTHDEVYEKSIEFYRNGLKGDLETAAFYGVPLPKWQPQYEKPYPVAAEVLEKLGGRYKLGVIANQVPRYCRQAEKVRTAGIFLTGGGFRRGGRSQARQKDIRYSS